MKTTFCIAILYLIAYHSLVTRQDGNYPGDKIIGLWQTPAREKVEIFKSAGHYYGKLIWGNRMFESDGTSKKDVHNPDPKLRTRPLQGLVILMDFAFKNDFWDDGKIYDYDGGQIYRSNINLKNDQLILHGYAGNDLFGKSVTWDRVK